MKAASAGAVIVAATATATATALPALSAPAERHQARVFVSGHSLTAAPFPAFLAAIADSLGTPMRWNQQHLFGSSIRDRTRGDPRGPPWNGYRTGKNRVGAGLDVLAELRRPATIDGHPYDVLLIAEQHSLLGAIMWNDTVRYLRHFHDRAVAANPHATTYLFGAWMAIDDRRDPRRWIAYERAAAPAWACVATRINRSLAHEGRADRIVPLPVGLALAQLSARALHGRGVRGLTAATPQATIDRLFRDDVHLTRTGSYYVALVTYAVIYGRSPRGAWHPPEMAAPLARVLQRAAAGFVAGQRRAAAPLSPEGCRRYVGGAFVGRYLAYQRDIVWRPGGVWRAYAKWARHSIGWRHALSRRTSANPLHYDPLRDRDYWFPPPP